ncbi:MAG: PHP domain-containing protein [Candidatus Thorarchaeota archaeon]|jgi:histidinol phosphatase-like PHP family hydrolase
MSQSNCDLHIHSDYSDGASTVWKIVERAARRRLDVIAIADHFWPSIGSRRGGTKLIAERRRLLKEMNSVSSNLRILDATEIDILADGTLAPISGGTEQFDLTIGSVHWSCDSTRWASTVKKAAEKGKIHILGHFDGYLSSYRPEDGRIAAEALASNSVAVELSTRYRPVHSDFLEAARDAGCLFSLGSDAHWTSNVGNVNEQAKLAEALNLPLLNLANL